MKEKKILYGIIIVFVFLLSAGLTYAYFNSTLEGNEEASEVETTTANLGEITFNDGNEINGSGIEPGWTTDKTFTISNNENSTERVSYAVILEVNVNTLTSVAEGAFKYSLTGESTNEGRTITIIDEIVPSETGRNVISIDGELNGEDTHTYTFTIEFEETGVNQNVAQGKMFSGYLQVEAVNRSGTMVWNSVSSLWEESTLIASEDCFEFSDGEIISYYDYKEDDEGKSTCPRKVNIPSTINEETVTTIGEYAFKEDNLTSVIIPLSITTINPSAFQYNNLTNVAIPSSVTTIGEEAFSYNNLTSITIPSTVTTIGGFAFEGNKLTSVTIPSSITEISAGVFYDNNLMNVTIPSSVTEIGEWAFLENSLTSITIPNSVTTIGDMAFAFNNLISVTIPSSVTKINERVFYDNNLTNVTIPSSVTEIGEWAFLENSLTSITIPSSVTTIGGAAFAFNKLTSVTIPSSVTELGYTAFNRNELPNNQAFIYARTDTNEDGIAEIDTTKVISYGGKEKNVTIPSSVTEIVPYAFQNNDLTSVIIPASVTTIKEYAFSYNNLTYACIKEKESPEDFSYYDYSMWAGAWATTKNIIWNCTY